MSGVSGETQVITTAVLAELLRITPQRVNQLVADGVIPKLKRGEFDLIPAVHAFLDYQASLRQESSLEAARRREVEARAEIKQMELDEMRGRLMPMSEAVERVDRIVQALDGSLAGQPRLLARAWAKKLGVPEAEVLGIVEEMIDQVREDLVQAAEGSDARSRVA